MVPRAIVYRVRPVPRAYGLAVGDWYHGEGAACVPHRRGANTDFSYSLEHRDNVVPGVGKVFFASHAPVGRLVFTPADGSAVTYTDFTYAEVRPHGLLHLRVTRQAAATSSGEGEATSTFSSTSEGLKDHWIWQPCHRSPFSHNQDSLLAGSFHEPVEYVGFASPYLDQSWGRMLAPTLVRAPCQGWHGEEAERKGEVTIFQSDDAVNRLRFEHLSSTVWEDTAATAGAEGDVRVYFFDKSASGIVTLRRLGLDTSAVRALLRGSATSAAAGESNSNTPALTLASAEVTAAMRAALRDASFAGALAAEAVDREDGATGAGFTRVYLRCVASPEANFVGTRDVFVDGVTLVDTQMHVGALARFEYAGDTSLSFSLDAPGVTDFKATVTLAASHAATVTMSAGSNIPSGTGVYWTDADGVLHVAFSAAQATGLLSPSATHLRFGPGATFGELPYDGSWAPEGATSHEACVAYSKGSTGSVFVTRVFTPPGQSRKVTDEFFVGRLRGKRVAPVNGVDTWFNFAYTPVDTNGHFVMAVNVEDDEHDVGYPSGAALSAKTAPPTSSPRAVVTRMVPCVERVQLGLTFTASPAGTPLTEGLLGKFIQSLAAALDVSPLSITHRVFTELPAEAEALVGGGGGGAAGDVATKVAFEASVTSARQNSAKPVVDKIKARSFANNIVGFTVVPGSVHYSVDKSLAEEELHNNKAHAVKILIALLVILAVLLAITIWSSFYINKRRNEMAMAAAGALDGAVDADVRYRNFDA